MDRYTKAQKKRLRRLSDTAYERELDHELEKLYRDFKKWRNKNINGFELNDLIHKHRFNFFHQPFVFRKNFWIFKCISELGEPIFNCDRAIPPITA
jgi:hypothetical protein